jgi:two-component system cell cycle response regulator DivK
MDASPARILIIEDNEDNRIIYRTLLQHAGYVVETAANGVAGVEVALATVPNVVLMDVGIPGIDGYTATRMLKRDPRTSHVPVIAVTAHAMPADRERALQAGCDHYIPKPADLRVILEHVQRAIADAPVASQG